MPVKEQAHRMGLDRSDFYKALNGLLPDRSTKQGRFDAHIAQLAPATVFTKGVKLQLTTGDFWVNGEKCDGAGMV